MTLILYFRSQLSEYLSADDMDRIKRDGAAHSAFKGGMPRSASNLSTFSTDPTRNSDHVGPAANSPQAAELTTANSQSRAIESTTVMGDKTKLVSWSS